MQSSDQLERVDPPPQQAERRINSFLSYPSRELPDDREPVRLTGRSSGQLTIGGMTEKELAAVEAFIRGQTYLACLDGRILHAPIHTPLPALKDDPVCAPHFPEDGELKQFGGVSSSEGWHSPSIIITALGAGISKSDRMRSAIEANQQKVLDCGFVCLRSQRLPDGCFHEHWVLHLWSADGPLKAHLDGLNTKHKESIGKKLDWHAEVEAACSFLARDLGVRFGSMDISIQRWALCVD